MTKAVFSDTDKVNIRWFWRNYIKEKSLWLILIMALIILQGFVYQQFLVYTEEGLRVIFDGGSFLDLIKICGFVILAFGLRAIISYIVPVLSARLAGEAVLKLRGHLIKKVMHLRQVYFDRNSSSELILRMVNQIDGLSQFVGHTSVNALRDSVTIIIVSGYLIYKSALLFFAALIVLPVIFLVLKVVSEAIKRIRKSAEKILGAYINSIDEMAGGVRTIKMSNQEETEIKRMYSASSGIKDLSIELQKAQALVLPAIDLSSAFVFVLVIGGGGYMVLSDDYSLDSASIITFILGMVIIFDPARSLSQFFTKMQASLVLVESIKSLLDTEDEKTDDLQKPNFCAENVKIILNNVSFSYVDDALLFDKISMEFKPGQKTAIVGSTGSGKTTILSLITRLYEVTDGQITFNGQDGRKFSRSSLRSHFSIVAQDVVIFNSSIHENIRYANPTASVEEIQNAAKRARIDTLMHERGDLPVGPKGSQLSGGQKQRISIARAFLRPAPVLVLDEATSALDALTEKSVNDSFYQLQKDKTTIVITHKLSSVLDADKIYVLESGKLIEAGTHEKLMQKDSIYKSMFNAQLHEDV